MFDSSARITSLISANLRRMGVVVDHNYSDSSGSQYLIVSYGEAGFAEYKIRISDHALPPTYHAMIGSADYDVSTSVIHEDCHTTEWFDAIFWVAGKFGLRVPPAVKAVKTRHYRSLAAAEERHRKLQDEQMAIQAMRKHELSICLSTAKRLGGRAAELAHWLERTDKRLVDMLTGGHGSKTRRNLKKRAKIKERELIDLIYASDTAGLVR